MGFLNFSFQTFFFSSSFFSPKSSSSCACHCLLSFLVVLCGIYSKALDAAKIRLVDPWLTKKVHFHFLNTGMSLLFNDVIKKHCY